MKNSLIKALFKLIFAISVFVVGLGAGLCANVFLVRGVPIINGGAEVFVFAAIPTAWVLGYKKGVRVTETKWRRRNERKRNYY